jgi:hypothetical protein
VAYLHELLFRALRADDVLAVGNEALPDERGLALRANEAVVVPVAVLERDEAGAADACRCKHICRYITFVDSVYSVSHSSHFGKMRVSRKSEMFAIPSGIKREWYACNKIKTV